MIANDYLNVKIEMIADEPVNDKLEKTIADAP